MSSLIAQASASFKRINEVLSAHEPKSEGEVKTQLTGRIKLDNVQLLFGEKAAIKNLTLEITPGSKTAIVGPTAAGKTQLLYLLTGLATADNGTIAFDGTPIVDFEAEAFYRQVGLVFQDSVMFNMSVRENVAFSDDISPDDLKRAIDTAELSDFLDTLPNGIDTIVSERGTSLSGGQKQRIMLARALALNPRILLLDDFTARVDSKTEQKIVDNLQRHYPDLTLISVTQKIAPIVNYDQIAVLMEGELVAKGTHDTLMASCPEYVQIFNSQRSTNAYDL
jgi:ATP-binding cassette subfamily B protein